MTTHSLALVRRSSPTSRRRLVAGGALALIGASLSCSGDGSSRRPPMAGPEGTSEPARFTARVASDADDCAIWVHPQDAGLSLVLGTDKASRGALHVWSLAGELLQRLDLRRPNNVDVRSGISVDGATRDIAMVNLRSTRELKAFAIDAATLQLSDITSAAGMPVPELADPYGLCLYSPSPGELHVFATSRSSARGRIFQYRVQGDGAGGLRIELVRELGGGAINGEIEGLVCDDELGFLYAAEEDVAVHKFLADPGAPVDALVSFAIEDGVSGDREGLAIYACAGGTGYVLLSSQGDSTLKVYPREGADGDPHNHPLLLTVQTPGVNRSDGIDATSAPLGVGLPQGMVVKHDSGDRRFALFAWEAVAAGVLSACD